MNTAELEKKRLSSNQNNDIFDTPEPVKFANFKPLKLDKNLTEVQINSEIDRYLRELDFLIKPINQPFDIKEEFQKLKSTPKEIRKQQISEFKVKMNSQIEGMSCCRMVIQGLIDSNPNIPLEILEKVFLKFAIKFGITGNELGKYRNLLRNFEDKRNIIIEFRKKFPDDLDLINQFKDIKEFSKFWLFKPHIKIQTTPYGFVIFMNSRDAKRIEKDLKISLWGFSKEVTLNYGHYGVEVSIAVILTDKYKLFGVSEDETKRHELEHSRDRYFHKGFSEKYNRGDIFIRNFSDLKNEISEIKKEKDYDEKEILLVLDEYLKYYFYLKINFALRGEVIARKKDLRNHDYEYITKSYGGLKELDREIKSLIHLNPDFSTELKTRIKITTDKYKNNFVNEVATSQKSFDRLIKEGGYTIDESIALMSFTPLKLWSKKIERILQSKR